MIYSPDHWIIVRINHPTNDKPSYKVVGGWSGGYFEGNSWRVNSGIADIVEKEDDYFIHGFSGSVYRCRKTREEIRHSMMPILAEFDRLNAEHGEDTVQIISIEEAMEHVKSNRE